MTIIEKLISLLETAGRMGAETDDPEGTRYIQISDTLANQLSGELRRFLLTHFITKHYFREIEELAFTNAVADDGVSPKARGVKGR